MRQVLDYLDRLSIEYTVFSHKPVYSMEDCAEIDSLDPEQHCKNLFLCNRQATDFYLACLPGAKRFVTSVVSKQLGAPRLQFAGDDDLHRLLGLRPGCVSPFGLLQDVDRRVKLALDEDLRQAKQLCFHPNTNTASLTLSRGAFFDYLDSLGIEPLYFHL